MRLIIPMAGRGTRVRPHSHVTPKPLLHVKGDSMIGRIVDTFDRILPVKVDETVFILGPDFGQDVRDQLTALCDVRGIKASFAVQEEALGTGHATYSAAAFMEGPGVVAFADALFDATEALDFLDADVVAFVKHVEDPRKYGVAVREGERIVEFVEKPAEIISNEALIGIYYIQELSVLRDAIRYLLDNKITGHGDEYQLTDAFDKMLKDGLVFKTASVSEWLDCGTIPALLETTAFILDKEKDSLRFGTVKNSIVHEPVYIAEGASVVNSVVGPHVSIEAGAIVTNAVVRDSILFENASVANAVLCDSLVGANAALHGTAQIVNIGNHSVLGPR